VDYDNYDTSVMDRAYLEWSQFTTARNAREIALIAAIERLNGAIDRGNPEEIRAARNHAGLVVMNAKVHPGRSRF
jgi:hypothetical protein